MVPKFILALLIVAMLALLARGAFTLARDNNEQKRTAKALTFRVAIAVTLIVFLIVAAAMGWIKPHGFGV